MNAITFKLGAFKFHFNCLNTLKARLRLFLCERQSVVRFLIKLFEERTKKCDYFEIKFRSFQKNPQSSSAVAFHSFHGAFIKFLIIEIFFILLERFGVPSKVHNFVLCLSGNCVCVGMCERERKRQNKMLMRLGGWIKKKEKNFSRWNRTAEKSYPF